MRTGIAVGVVVGIVASACASEGARFVGDAMVVAGDMLRDAGNVLSDAGAGSAEAMDATQDRDAAPAVSMRDAAPSPATDAAHASDAADRPTHDGTVAVPSRTRLTGSCTYNYAGYYWAEFELGSIDITTQVITGYKCDYEGNNPAGYLEAGDCTNAWEPMDIRGSKLLVRCSDTAGKWNSVVVVLQ
jgi:hypothetical protein